MEVKSMLLEMARMHLLWSGKKKEGKKYNVDPCFKGLSLVSMRAWLSITSLKSNPSNWRGLSEALVILCSVVEGTGRILAILQRKHTLFNPGHFMISFAWSW